MEEINQSLNFKNEVLLCEIEKYLKTLTKKCPNKIDTNKVHEVAKEIAIGPDTRDVYSEKLNIIGDMGKLIIEKIKLLSKNLNNPKNLEDKIAEFEKTCQNYSVYHHRTYEFQCDDLLYSFKIQSEEMINLSKKSIKKFIKNSEFEHMKKQIEELKSKNLNLEQKVKSFETNQNTNAARFFSAGKEATMDSATIHHKAEPRTTIISDVKQDPKTMSVSNHH